MAIFDRMKKTKKTDETTAKAAPKKATKKAEKVEKADVAPKAASAGSVMTQTVIIRPLVTEKAAHMGTQNKYGFVVMSSATKNAIKNAVESMYKVDVKGVNVQNVQGRVVRFGRNAGKRSDFKKAIVTLAPGQTIAVHEGV